MILVGLQVRHPWTVPEWRPYVGDGVGTWRKQRWRAMRELHEMIGPVSVAREPWARGPDIIFEDPPPKRSRGRGSKKQQQTA